MELTPSLVFFNWFKEWCMSHLTHRFSCVLPNNNYIILFKLGWHHHYLPLHLNLQNVRRSFIDWRWPRCSSQKANEIYKNFHWFFDNYKGPLAHGLSLLNAPIWRPSFLTLVHTKHTSLKVTTILDLFACLLENFFFTCSCDC